jgi:hypothetical protein
MLRDESVFSCFLVGKARVFSLNPGGNSHYKYQPSSFTISDLEQEQFKRKEILGASRGVFIWYFLSLVICL